MYIAKVCLIFKFLDRHVLMLKYLSIRVTTRLLDAIERTTAAKLSQTDQQIREQLEKTLNSVGISMVGNL